MPAFRVCAETSAELTSPERNACMLSEQQEMQRQCQATHRQMGDQSFSPAGGEDEPGGGTNKNILVPQPGKNSRNILLPLPVNNDQKYLNLESVNSTLSKISVANELASNEKNIKKFMSVKSSSTAIQNTDDGHQKRPIKLAPLNLPEEVKEAQLKKINAMKDDVYLIRKNNTQVGKVVKAPSDRPMIREPLRKADFTQDNLPKLKAANLLSKDNLGQQGSSPPGTALPGNIQTRTLSSSIVKLEKRRIRDSVPAAITINSADVQNIPDQEGLKFGKGHNNNPNLARPVKVDRLVIVHVDRTASAGRKDNNQRRAKLVTPVLKI
ncbi:uncharacterized protein [Hyperolius riggenbachi]|uniref:uncharacterized protein n=1 Tax=Hyperolius riggenbachi TaxID=752182 RepID=UPI0035A27651